MKKMMAISLVLLACLAMPGCADIEEDTGTSEEWVPLFMLIAEQNKEFKTFLEDIEGNPPVKVVVQYWALMPENPYKESEQAVDIKAVYGALSSMEVRPTDESMHTDDYLCYYLILQDGSSYMVTFQSNMYLDEVNGFLYEVNGLDKLYEAFALDDMPSWVYDKDKH